MPARRFKTRRFLNEPGQAHEYTFSCFGRLELLGRDRTRQWFVEALESIRQRYGVLILAYVIMPEHVHVLILPGPAVCMEQIAKALKQSVARRALAWLRCHDPTFLHHLEGERAGPRHRYHFWQPGGGYDRNITNADTLLAMVQYIHHNPVRRGLVKTAEDWPWSSARFYANLDDVKLPMDRVEI